MMRHSRPRQHAPAPPKWIEISGFKSLREPVRVQLRPLTLLAGANSSGKSSVMQPLLMMKQTLEAAYDPGALLMSGPHIRFTQPDEFLARDKKKDSFADAVHITFGPVAEAIRRPVDGDESTYRESPPLRFSFRPSSRKHPDQGLAPVEIAQQRGNKWCVLSEDMSIKDFARAYKKWDSVGAKTIENLRKARIHRIENRFSTHFTVRANTQEIAGPQFTLDPASVHHMWLSSILHLPGLRGHRERRYNAARVGQHEQITQVPGPFTPYVASLLVSWQTAKDVRCAQVNTSMEELGLTWKVKARRISAADVELKVARTPHALRGGANDLVSIADVGFGVSQVLPVIVALTTAHEGQLVYIEQPELHLHPRAQYAMGKILARAAQRGVRVVVETHSRMILRAVQLEVAKPEGLPHGDVGLHWFQRNPTTGTTKVDLAELDKHGAFGEWPIDFSDVEAEADSEWMTEAFGSHK